MTPADWEKMGVKAQQPAQPDPIQTQQPVKTSGMSSDDWAKMGVSQQPQSNMSQSDWAKMGVKAQPNTSVNQPVRERDDGSPLLHSLVKVASGSSLVEMYDKLTSSLPDEFKGYAGHLAIELVRGVPEVADAALSFGGIGMAIAHAYPPLRPAALVADAVLGVMQTGQALASVSGAVSQPSAEHVGEAIKDSLFALGFVKGAGGQAREMGRGADYAAEAKTALQKLKDLATEKGDNKAVRQFKKDQQETIWDDINTPKSPMEGLYQKLYTNKATSPLAKIFIPPPRNVAIAREMVMDQDARTNFQKWNTKMFLKDLRENTSPEDRDISKMGYVIQDSATPDDVGLSDDARIAVEKYRNFNEDTVKYIKEAYGNIHVPLQNARTYLSQMWDFSKMEQEPGKLNRNIIDNTARRMMRDPFMKSRNIIKEGDGPIDYKDAIENYGWVPKFNDVADVIEHRMNYLVQSAENQRTAKALYDIGAIMTPQKAAKMGLRWPEATDATALYRAAYSGSESPKNRVNRQTGAITVERTVTLERKPVVVAPWIKPAVDALFAPGLKFSEMGPNGVTQKTLFGQMETVRAFSKQVQVMASLFHNFSEMSQGMAVQMGHGKPLEAAKSIFIWNPEYGRGIRSSMYEMAGKSSGDVPPVMRLTPEAAKDMILEARINLNTSDQEEAVIRGLRQFNGHNLITKAMQPLVRKTGDAAKMFNKSLFDYYVPGLMMSAYETIKAREIPKLRPGATEAEIRNLKQNIGAHINRVFGTESLQSLLIHPKTRQGMAFALFAPVWTITNARMLTAGWENETQRTLRNKWFGGAAVSLFLGTNLANYATTSWFSRDKDGNHDWKGRWAFENPGLPLKVFGRTMPVSDRSFSIYTGRDPDNSAETYVSPGKGEKEGFAWMVAPIETLAGKMHAIPKAFWTIMGGTAPGTDYQVIAPKERASDTERNIQRGFVATDPITPFFAEYGKKLLEHKMIPQVVPKPSPSQSTLYGLPLGQPEIKGVTFTNAVIAYREYMGRGDIDNAKRVLSAAAANAQPVGRIIAEYRRIESQRRSTERGRPPRPVPGATPPPPK